MRLFGDERAQFDAALRARNLVPPKDVIADGSFHRCNARGTNGKADGSYVVYGDGTVPAGGIQNFKDGIGWQPWCYQPHGRDRTPAEDAEAAAKSEEARKRRDASVRDGQERAAGKARRLWDAAVPVTTHQYLTRKQLQPNGARALYSGSVLVVPAKNAGGTLCTLQFIDKDGHKRFLKGGEKKGCYYAISGHGSTVYITEGFATAASIHEITDCTAIVAFDAGNLQPVVQAVREKYPNTEIVICADDDWKTNGNPGLAKARGAARAVNATIAVPDFGQNRRDKDTDFNDLFTFIGAGAVKRSIAAAMAADQCLAKQLEADPFAALQDAVAEELADYKRRDRKAFEELRLRLRKAGVRSAALDEVVEDKQPVDDGDEQLRLKQADVLLGLVTKNASVELFHTGDRTAFAAIRIDGHREIHTVKGSDFRRWLRDGFFDLKQSSPSSEAMTTSVATIDAIAVRKGKQHEVHLRVAELDGKFYLDLCDAGWRAVEIGADGWRVLAEPPVRFRRKAGMLELPTPVSGGLVELLRPFLNVHGDNDFVLLVAFLLAALQPRAPYPVLAIAGSHGGGKSTVAEMLRMLVDPSTSALRTLPREDRELFISSRSAHMLAFDNLSSLPPWTSDALCRIADGAGFACRALFTDDDEVLFGGARPIVLNGIEDVIVRPDLADRTIMITLEEIPEQDRARKSELFASFQEAQPKILGALLDAMSLGLSRLPDVRLPRLPRLADFATWATACETACFEDGAFMAAFDRNREEAIRTVLEADAVALAILRFMETRADWEGTATDLLGCLNAIVGEAEMRTKAWPKAAHVLAGRLRRTTPFLRKRGILVDMGYSGDHKWERRIFISHTGPLRAKEASAASAASASNKPNGLDQNVDVDFADASSVDPCEASAEASANTSPEPIENTMDGDGADGADGADASFPTPSLAGEKENIPTPDGTQTPPTCSQCQMADGKAALFEDEDGEPVWLHMECRRFWLKAQKSPWR
ncbi:MAG TPA: toprim domain-containing protein [Xanthobacteraceae bacterium]